MNALTMTAPQLKTDNLFLILKGKWYGMIDAGIKLEEYRDLTDYWKRRLENRNYKTVTFQLGYSLKKRMTFEVKYIGIGKGNQAWGGGDKYYYIIKLGKRL